MTQSAGVRTRKDANRNRTRIIEVAQEAFREPEEPSMAEVARRAGVGMATLYRNFPGRLELLTELYRTEIEDICAATITVEGDSPGERLLNWLSTFHAVGGRKGPLISLLRGEPGRGGSDDGDAVVTGSRALVVRAGEPLLLAAQNNGEVRVDVSIRQVLDAIAALGQVGEDPASSTTLVQVFIDGLRVRS
ncbi:TetR/AcrR family transcriptional regulator [Nocardioides aurantiacus]|uniref:TetR family transcriptional regulator n=1 Tax=Nocardioides aurantiacus TaxID=86796 RepID=A0A3N2CTR1_9ACTN|nr:TetR/AcrR family transcriptional regulator [Nocardioides aurantiacus]ROR90923.1 TetR family transcriptional regulator [Nocardioides aurantiacus]